MPTVMTCNHVRLSCPRCSCPLCAQPLPRIASIWGWLAYAAGRVTVAAVAGGHVHIWIVVSTASHRRRCCAPVRTAIPSVGHVDTVRRAASLFRGRALHALLRRNAASGRASSMASVARLSLARRCAPRRCEKWRRRRASTSSTRCSAVTSSLTLWARTSAWRCTCSVPHGSPAPRGRAMRWRRSGEKGPAGKAQRPARAQRTRRRSRWGCATRSSRIAMMCRWTRSKPTLSWKRR